MVLFWWNLLLVLFLLFCLLVFLVWWRFNNVGFWRCGWVLVLLVLCCSCCFCSCCCVFVLFLFLLLCVRVVLVLFMSVGSSSVLFVCVVSNYLLCWGCVLRLCSVKELGSRLFKVPLNPLVVHCSAFWSVLFVFVLICLSFWCCVLSRD